MTILSTLRGRICRATSGALLAVVGGLSLLHSGLASAISITPFTALADWQAAAGPSTLQDFSGYALGTPLEGVEVLPGVTASSNLDLEVFGADLTMAGFGPARTPPGTAYYELAITQPYTALALEIAAFEPAANGGGGAVSSGTLEFLFSGGFSYSIVLSAKADESNVFFGVVSDTTITRVRWYEAFEESGGNEETSLDNIRVGDVPEPSTYALMLAGLGLLGLAARRRRR